MQQNFYFFNNKISIQSLNSVLSIDNIITALHSSWIIITARDGVSNLDENTTQKEKNCFGGSISNPLEIPVFVHTFLPPWNFQQPSLGWKGIFSFPPRISNKWKTMKNGSCCIVALYMYSTHSEERRRASDYKRLKWTTQDMIILSHLFMG